MIEGRAMYGNLENKINMLCWPVENSIAKNNDRTIRRQTIDKRAVTLEHFCMMLLTYNLKQ
jgi:hypothetical protein